MVRSSFPLFQSHLDLAHQIWSQIVKPGDFVIDATCGNGHDSMILAKLAVTISAGLLQVIDIQKEALNATRSLLSAHLSVGLMNRIEFIHNSHSQFNNHAEQSVALIVYNLGYLPGGDKNLTTKKETTLQSLHSAVRLIKSGGAISITCYPGHSEGKVEEESVLEFGSSLNPQEWSCCHYRWLNRQAAPSLFLMQRKLE